MAFLEGLKKHWQVFRAALADERQRKAEAPEVTPRSRQEMAFLPAELEIIETPPSPLGRTVPIVIIAFFSIAVTWASIGEMDIIATAQGKIIPTSRVKVIQPLESGVIRAIHVTDGQSVTKGTVLVELDPTGVEADRDRLANELMTARIEAARLDALSRKKPLAAFKPPQGISREVRAQSRAYLASQWEEHQADLRTKDAELNKSRAEIRAIEAEIRRLGRLLPNMRERVEGRRKLLKKRIIARLSFLEIEQELLELEGQLDVQTQRLEEARSTLATGRAQRKQVQAEFRRSVLAELSEVRKQLHSLEQELIKAEDRNRLQNLTTPVDGVVQQLAIHTIGGVVTPAQELMVIVPADSRIEIEAMVLNKDIGFVHSGQEAEIKVESFPFTRYGIIVGKLLHISRDSVQDEKMGLIFPARIAMAKSTITVSGQEVPLTPGMNTTVEIKTGKRKLIEYLLAPLQRYKKESMRER